jgi:Leucine-rich repeat (LRR) protein
VEKLRGLFSLSLSHNQISELKPMAEFAGLYNLYLENNKIRDLTPLVEMVKKDKEQRYAPFLNLYLKGNPLSSAAKGKQAAALKELGVRLNN